jgi:iron complex outermembrane recepter protein
MGRKQFCFTLAAGMVLGNLTFPAAVAQGSVQTYRIDPQPLGAALKQFATVSGVEMLFNEADVAGKQAPALDGRYERYEALDQLLSSSGLQPRPAGPNTIVLRLAQNTEPPPADKRSPPNSPRPTATPKSTAAPADAGLETIIVTAQKREQSINDVPMSITAITGDSLLQRGIVTTADLDKIVPGFTQATTQYATPIYSLRGVGLYDTGFASSPAVTVYVDEVPLPFPVMTMGALLDLQRVEVLKGPQGTLFGQNSTGGAVNYIAAKPTDSVHSGMEVSYERFNKIDTNGFLSGPLSDTLRARLAVRAVEGGAWQTSLTRPDDQLGADRQLLGRLLLDWTPIDALKVSLNINGNTDDTDVQAGQLVKILPKVPARVDPALLTQPLADNNDRDADWTPSFPLRRHNRFMQEAIRVDYDLTPNTVLTSISSYERQTIHQTVDYDATILPISNALILGSIDSLNQELRLAGDRKALTWVAGGNYEYDKADDTTIFYYDGLSSAHPLPSVPAFGGNIGTTPQHIDTFAAFGNAEYALTDALSLHAGMRYTDSSRRATTCSKGIDPYFAQLLTAIQQLYVKGGLKSTPVIQLTQNDCASLTPAPDLSPIVGGSALSLSQQNISWRAGLEYKTPGGTLLYANDSRGWKAGIISNIIASSTSEFNPATQERLDAYEGGIKTPLFGNRAHLDAAAFYYDYRNKQVQTKQIDPIFGPVTVIANVPKSRVWGIDGALVTNPLVGLTLSLSGTYIQSKVTHDWNGVVNQEGVAGNFKGSKLPYAPSFTGIADAQYERPLKGGWMGFIGASLTHRNSTSTTFATAAAPAPDFVLPASNVLDVRLGVAAADDTWRVTVFGRNVTDDYYYNFVFNGSDTINRSAARPLTYGANVSVKFE